MGRPVKKYCIDCGKKLTYIPNLSNTKAPNEYRNLIYECETCNLHDGKRKFISMKRATVNNAYDTVQVKVDKEKSKYNH